MHPHVELLNHLTCWVNYPPPSLTEAVVLLSPDQAKAGKSVDVEELPPVISVGQKEVKPHPQPRPQPQAAQGGNDEFELSEEDLAAWAGSLVDDRQKKQGMCVCVCGGGGGGGGVGVHEGGYR